MLNIRNEVRMLLNWTNEIVINNKRELGDKLINRILGLLTEKRDKTKARKILEQYIEEVKDLQANTNEDSDFSFIIDFITKMVHNTFVLNASAGIVHQYELCVLPMRVKDKVNPYNFQEGTRIEKRVKIAGMRNYATLNDLNVILKRVLYNDENITYSDRFSIACMIGEEELEMLSDLDVLQIKSGAMLNILKVDVNDQFQDETRKELVENRNVKKLSKRINQNLHQEISLDEEVVYLLLVHRTINDAMLLQKHQQNEEPFNLEDIISPKTLIKLVKAFNTFSKNIEFTVGELAGYQHAFQKQNLYMEVDMFKKEFGLLKANKEVKKDYNLHFIKVDIDSGDLLKADHCFGYKGSDLVKNKDAFHETLKEIEVDKNVYVVIRERNDKIEEVNLLDSDILYHLLKSEGVASSLDRMKNQSMLPKAIALINKSSQTINKCFIRNNSIQFANLQDSLFNALEVGSLKDFLKTQEIKKVQ